MSHNICLLLVIWSVIPCCRTPDLRKSSHNADPIVKTPIYNPLIIAHRGYSKQAPENTLVAFQKATAAGSHLVELDIHVTKDGIPIVVHDGTLDRTTDVEELLKLKQVKPSDLSYKEINRLDAGSWFAAQFTGEKIPSLSAAIDTIKQGKSITLIEHKSGEVSEIVAELKDFEAGTDYFVQSFNWDFLKKFSKKLPKTPLYALGGEEITPALLEKFKSMNIRGLSWNKDDLDRKAVNLVHDMGFQLFAFTVDDLDLAASLIRMGVDGIITDNPEELKALLERMNQEAHESN